MAQRTFAGKPNSSSVGIGGALILIAVVLGILVIAIFYPRSEGRIGDPNNSAPSVRTVRTVPVSPP
jgi:hypothetical protein